MMYHCSPSVVSECVRFTIIHFNNSRKAMSYALRRHSISAQPTGRAGVVAHFARSVKPKKLQSNGHVVACFFFLFFSSYLTSMCNPVGYET